jgi:murein DD-endopeptidase MepM/ murein hydrolase activator NlpD
MIPWRSTEIKFWIVSVSILLGTACQPVAEATFIPPAPRIVPPTIVTTDFLADTLLTQVTPRVSRSFDNDYAQASSVEQPVKFDFPTPHITPITEWRPALYPVPLALTPFDHFYFSRPFAANEVYWPVEDYRYGGSFFEDVVHTGLDIKMPVGTPILAAGPGKVVWAGYGLFYGRYDLEDPYGQAVMIRHDFGFQGSTLYTVYAHLDEVYVVQDQYIKTGELLGLSGKTGVTSGPHLHFEVRIDQDGFFATYNPELWLVPPQGWGVLAGRVMNTGGRKVEGQLVIVRPKNSEQFWRANSYHRGYINSDPYYQENLVISDLPAGEYEIAINYLSRIYRLDMNIHPGLVSYFSFRGRSGFTTEPPPVPGADFNPPQTP